MTERGKIIKLWHDNLNVRIARRAGADVDPLGIPVICEVLMKCIGSSDYDFEEISSTPFAILVTSEEPSSEFLLNPITLPQFIIDNTNDSSNVIVVNYDGFLVRTIDKLLLSVGDASDFSEVNKGILFFIIARRISVVVSGKSIDQIPNASSFKPALNVRGDELAIDEWKKILKKYEKEIKGQKRFFYWATPKTKGKLLDAPEKLFRKDLAKYIEENTVDCGVDEEAYNDNSTDRVDIRVTTGMDAHVYYFELKCLGECESGTINNEDHAHSGLVQVNIYVVNDSKSKEGILVVFDGRGEVTDINWPEEIVKTLDKRVNKPPTVMKLERHSASEISKAVVREIRKKK